MFEKARLKLTTWYLLIITLITVLFSIAFYQASTREVERLINRIEFRQEFPGMSIPDRPPRGAPTQPNLEELEQSKRQLLFILIVINSGVIVVAGVASYFLAGRTLRPIKLMLDEQDQFISNASHELRTPIATMRAEMEGSLLEKHISDKNARSLIFSNLQELGSLQNLTNNLLKLAQVHNSSFDNNMHKLSLLEIIKSAKNKVAILASKKQIKILIRLEEYFIIGDKANLTEVFVTLLDNAIKYSPTKSNIKIISEKQNKVVKISIVDQGEGISNRDLPHVFRRFFRSDKSRSKTEGYGLGLSIAQRIVETHKGLLTVKSIEKKGTTFIVQLPLINF